MYYQKRQTDPGELRLKESQTILAGLFQIYSQVTLVVDALDECNKENRLDLMDILDNFIAESSTPVRILISSRRDGDIKRHFENGPNLEIRAIDTRDDIAMVVKDGINTCQKRWPYDISSEVKKLIFDTLVAKSGGM